MCSVNLILFVNVSIKRAIYIVQKEVVLISTNHLHNFVRQLVYCIIGKLRNQQNQLINFHYIGGIFTQQNCKDMSWKFLIVVSYVRDLLEFRISVL